jgi:hypothetical protein
VVFKNLMPAGAALTQHDIKCLQSVVDMIGTDENFKDAFEADVTIALQNYSGALGFGPSSISGIALALLQSLSKGELDAIYELRKIAKTSGIDKVVMTPL